MPEKKTVARRQWTKGDVRELKVFAKQKIGVAKIAKRLKRTPGATAKAHTLRVSLSTQYSLRVHSLRADTSTVMLAVDQRLSVGAKTNFGLNVCVPTSIKRVPVKFLLGGQDLADALYCAPSALVFL